MLLIRYQMKFRKNKNIVILKPYKGNGMVTVDKTIYDDSIMNIISDSLRQRITYTKFLRVWVFFLN